MKPSIKFMEICLCNINEQFMEVNLSLIFVGFFFSFLADFRPTKPVCELPVQDTQGGGMYLTVAML